MREPVEPASIMSAYWTRGREGLEGLVQCVVLEGSGSASNVVACCGEGGGEDAARSSSMSAWCVPVPALAVVPVAGCCVVVVVVVVRVPAIGEPWGGSRS